MGFKGAKPVSCGDGWVRLKTEEGLVEITQVGVGRAKNYRIAHVS